MVDKIAQQVASYLNLGKSAGGASQGDSFETSFGDVLKNTVRQSIDTIRGGEVASAKAVAGEASLPDVVQAITASEVTLQTVVAVRDRMVGAYQEILRMPV